MSFPEKLKSARLDAGKTQQDVADILGIDKSTYSGYETGKREPFVERIKELAKIFNVTGDYLLETGFDEPQTKKSPTSEESEVEDDKEEFELFCKGLSKLGIIGEVDDITDEQLGILMGVMQILNSTFPGQTAFGNMDDIIRNA